jgi:hypothetical protein
MNNLPEDLTNYLKHKTGLSIKMTGPDAEVTEITLYPIDEIQKKRFDISRYEILLNYSGNVNPKDLEKYGDDRSEYEGYDLIKSCNDYDPEGVLVYFPDWKQYGSWDSDHHLITVYPGRNWGDILRDPKKYINGQWYPDNVTHKLINPWERKAKWKLLNFLKIFGI